MIFRDTLCACPSCGCHFRRGEPSCPHCDAEVDVTRGQIAPTAVALFLGLASVLPVAGGCIDGDEGSGVGGYSYDFVGSNVTVSTYGTGGTGGDYDYSTTTNVTTSATSTGGSSGEGGAGGEGGGAADLQAECEACLVASCGNWPRA